MNRSFKLGIVVLLSWSSLVAQGGPGADAEVSARIDRMLSKVYKPGEPGAAVLVVRDGRLLLRKGYGMASLEWDIPVEPDMVFRIGSVTKQFTAAAILMLAEERKLGLHDTLGEILPDYPVNARSVTVEQLLTHTSGIKSYTNLPGWWSRMRQDITVDGLIDLFKNQPMEFEPGTKWRYNNSGYVLLGAIIEKLSGMTYREFIRRRIFKPVGMKHSYYGDNVSVIPKRVPGYEKLQGEFVNAPYLSMTQPYAAGALLSSVDDLRLWDDALYGERILHRESIERMFTPGKLRNGATTGYGYGWMIGEFEGLATMEHGGGVNGFLSHVLRMPERRIYIAILSNNSFPETFPGLVAKRIAGILIGKPLEEPRPIRLSEKQLDEYVGMYTIDQTTSREVMRIGNRLYTQRTEGPRLEIFPTSESVFFYKGSLDKITFFRDADGRITHLVMESYGQQEAGYRQPPLLHRAPEGRPHP